MTFETLLTQDRIEAHTEAGYWTGKIITDYLDEVARLIGRLAVTIE